MLTKHTETSAPSSKMSVICLGWGSLVWNPGCLPIEGDWHTDGPTLPIEFARESKDGRITLVLTEDAEPVKSLWTILEVTSLDEAKRCLAKREEICSHNVKYSIGFWEKGGKSHGRCKSVVGKWASSANLNSVIWTNLKFGFKGRRDQMPTVEEVVCHLQGLDETARQKAKVYVRYAPRQIRTMYRARIEAVLGWYPPDGGSA